MKEPRGGVGDMSHAMFSPQTGEDPCEEKRDYRLENRGVVK